MSFGFIRKAINYCHLPRFFDEIGAKIREIGRKCAHKSALNDTLRRKKCAIFAVLIHLNRGFERQIR